MVNVILLYRTVVRIRNNLGEVPSMLPKHWHIIDIQYTVTIIILLVVVYVNNSSSVGK